MSDPGNGKDPHEKPSDDPVKSGGFLSGSSFFRDIGLALLAGAAFAAFQFGGDMLDRLEKWIDGESYTPAAVVRPELPAQSSGTAPTRPMIAALDGDVLKVGAFRLNMHPTWTIEPVSPIAPTYTYFKNLLNPSVEYSGNDSAILVGIPESYLVEMPDDAGQIILLRQQVLINRKLSYQEGIDLIAKAGPDGVVVISGSDRKPGDGRQAPLSLDESKPVVFSGSVDPATISENDLFDQYFLQLLSTLYETPSSPTSPVELKLLRRRSVAGYEIGEIDYIFGAGPWRFSAVYYWKLDDGAQWGEFGAFLTSSNEPVLRKHRKMIASLSSLSLMDGENEVWRGLNSQAPAGNNPGPFAHVQVDANKLLLLGLDVRQVESEVQAQLPVSADELENMRIMLPGGAMIHLRDIANMQLYPLGGGTMLRAPESVVITVTQ